MKEENEIDLDALQNSIDEVIIEDKDKAIEEIVEDIVEELPDFDLDGALDSFEPISLDGKVTEEEAITKATQRGWREDGKDKYGHQISAIEFLERTPLFHKMDLMRGDIDEIKAQNKKLTEQSKLIAKNAIDEKSRLLADFKKEKEDLLSTELLDKDDIDKLKTLDKQIEDNAVEDTVNNEVNDQVKEYEEAKDTFVSENEWYQNNRAMTKLADKRGKEYAETYYKENNVLPAPEDLFSHVIEEVKKDFPEMGKPRRSTKVATRSNRTVTSNHKKKQTLDDLPEDQRAVARYVMDSADMTEDEYMTNYGVN